MRQLCLLVIALLVLASGCASPKPAPAEPMPAAPEPTPIEEAQRPLPSEPALPRAEEQADEEGAEEADGAEQDEELAPGFAKLTLADPDDPIGIASWGIERGPGDSAELVNVTFIVRNTGREPLTGQILFEAWQESIFFKKMWDIKAVVPPGQSYTFTRDAGVILDAPKVEKQMRAVLIVTDGVAVGGEDHKFFVPIKR